MTAALTRPSIVPDPPTLWTSSLADDLPEVDWSSVAAEPAERLAALRALRDLGFVVIRGGPRGADGIEEMGAIIGPLVPSAYGTIWSLRPEQSETVIGNTNEPVEPHTDEAYRHDPPGIRILYCVTPAAQGGEVVLVDGFTVAARLRVEAPAAYALLAAVRQPFVRVVREDGIDQRTQARSIVADDRGEVLGVRFQTISVGPMEGAVDDPAAMREANERMRSLTVDPELAVELRLGAGDAVLFDNHRVLHARLGFSGRARHHQISTLSREDFHQALRTTAFSVGSAEADQCLGAGLVG